MEIARLLLPPDAVLLHATAHTTTTTLDAGGTHSSEPARGRSRTQSTYYAVDGGEWEEGAGATGRALVSGGRAVVSGVASALGGLASAVGSWYVRVCARVYVYISKNDDRRRNQPQPPTDPSPYLFLHFTQSPPPQITGSRPAGPCWRRGRSSTMGTWAGRARR